MGAPAFAELAASPGPGLAELALAIAREVRGAADSEGALAALARLGAEVREEEPEGSPREQAAALRRVLGERHGFAGDTDDYDHPDNSMLDLVLARRRGLPILLSVVYVETAVRAGIPLAGVGLPGHFVVGHFGAAPPVLLDPFHGGRELRPEAHGAAVRPWGAHETALRMLNNLVASYAARGDLGRALEGARLRLSLPLAGSARRALELELRALRARLN